MALFGVIGLDADDTLWQNERNYNQAQSEFAQILGQYHSEEWVRERLLVTETRNLEHFGYGIKSFILSMIETAVELTEGRVTGQDVGRLVELARGMVNAPVELLPGVAEVIPLLAKHHRLALITKGDLLDQERKLENSGLAPYFAEVEVVSQKTSAVYAHLLRRYEVAPNRFVMVGNSLRSDVLPVLSLGGHAIHIPHETTWAHEQAEAPRPGTPGFYSLPDFTALPELLQKLETGERYKKGSSKLAETADY